MQVHQYCSDLRTNFVGGIGRPTAFQQARLCNILTNTQLAGKYFVCTVILYCGVFSIQVRQYCSDLRMVFVSGTGRQTDFLQVRLCNIMSDKQLLS